MASAAQVSANRANAQKSTDPRTPEGKAAVARNAVQHGLLAQEVVIKGEDPGEFELYREGMLAELAPAGSMESMRAERIVGLAWRLRRAERLQAAAFDKVEEKNEPSLPVLSPEDTSWLLAQIAERGMHVPAPVHEGPAVGRRAVQDFNQERILDRLLMYERRIEHSLYRTMAELRNLRRWREQNPLKVGATAEGGVAEESVGQAPPYSPRLPEEVGRGHPTLDRIEGRLYEEMPDGVATNMPDAEESSCETKPICDPPMAQAVAEATAPSDTGILPVVQSHGQDAHATETPDGVTTNGADAQEPSCETNPISARANKGQVPYRPIFRRRR